MTSRAPDRARDRPYPSFSWVITRAQRSLGPSSSVPGPVNPLHTTRRAFHDPKNTAARPGRDNSITLAHVLANLQPIPNIDEIYILRLEEALSFSGNPHRRRVRLPSLSTLVVDLALVVKRNRHVSNVKKYQGDSC